MRRIQPFLVFAAATTDVEFILTVTDTVPGTAKTYENPLGSSFAPMPDLNFSGNDQLDVLAEDQFGSANGMVNITVNPINDAPEAIVPGQQTLFTDTDFVSSKSTGNEIQIRDVDAGDANVQVDLVVTNGSLLIADRGGVSIKNNGSNIVQITGSVADINKSIGGDTVTFRTRVPGSQELLVIVNDLHPTNPKKVTERIGLNVEVSDVVPPRITSIQLNDGSRVLPGTQRSALKVKSIVVSFDQVVQFGGAVADAFRIDNTTTMQRVTGFTATADNATGKTVVTIRDFLGASVDLGQSLADGSYTIKAFSGQIAANGQQLDGDRNGTPGPDAVDTFMRRFGDEDGDGKLDTRDIEAGIALALGTSIADENYDQRFDFDEDGVITFSDFFELLRRAAN